MISIKNALVGNRAVGFGKLTDDWSSTGNPSIEKLPHRSLELTRKIRVGSDSEMLHQIDDGYERIRDAILPFARGVDPMVGVQTQNANGKRHASLAYKMGTFRPPIVKQSDVLPLSRLPREPTFIQLNPKLPTDTSADHAIQERAPLLNVSAYTTRQAKSSRPHQPTAQQLHAKARDLVSSVAERRNEGKTKADNPYVELQEQLRVNATATFNDSRRIQPLQDYTLTLPERSTYSIESKHSFPQLHQQHDALVDRQLVDRHVIAYTPAKKEMKKQNEIFIAPLPERAINYSYTTTPRVKMTTTNASPNVFVKQYERINEPVVSHALVKRNVNDDRVLPSLPERALSYFSFDNR